LGRIGTDAGTDRLRKASVDRASSRAICLYAESVKIRKAGEKGAVNVRKGTVGWGRKEA